MGPPGDSRSPYAWGDVIATLANQGVTVSSAQVSTVLRQMGMRKRQRNGKAAVRRGLAKSGETMLSLDHLIAAKHLAEKLGGIEEAKTALDALARLS